MYGLRLFRAWVQCHGNWIELGKYPTTMKIETTRMVEFNVRFQRIATIRFTEHIANLNFFINK